MIQAITLPAPANRSTLEKELPKTVEDYHLSRFACYLIAQNGDPRKPEIAHAQEYFAIQIRLKKVEKRLKTSKPKLYLDDKDSGLLPQNPSK